MRGETPDDIETRRVANEKVVQKALRDSLALAFPPPTDDEATVAQPQQSPSAGVRDINRMTDYATGLTAANDRMDRIEHSVELMAGEISKVAGLVSKVSEKVDERFNTSMLQADARATALVAATRTDFSKFSTPVTLAATVFLFLIGGFAGYVEVGVNTDFTRLEKNIDKLMEAQGKRADKVDERFEKFVENTVPRREADNRFERNEALLTRKVDKDVFSKTTEYRDDQIATLRADVSNLLKDSVKRADIDGRFSDFTKRLDLISNRVEQLQATSAGTAILQEQVKEIQDSVREVRSRLLGAPKYLVRPDQQQQQ